MKKSKFINIKNVILFLLIIVTVVTSIIILNVKETVVKGNITIWTDSESYDYLNNISQEFIKENEKCKVSIVKVDEESINEKLQDAEKKNKLPDLITIKSSEINNFIEREDIKDKIKNCNFIISKNGNNISKRELQNVSVDGSYMSIPFTSKPILLYLRQDMLNEYGYSNKDFNTWNDLIDIGKSIYEKSGQSVKILNCVGQDKDYIVSLLIMQSMEELKSSDEEITTSKVKEKLMEKYTLLTDNNILNTKEDGKFLARLSSVEGMHELSALDAQCEWTANYAPSVTNGSNKFYIESGKSFIVFDNGNQKNPVINKYIGFLSDNKSKINILLEQRFFLSYLSLYDSSKVDENVYNFSGKSPLIFMANDSKKAPVLPDYDVYEEVKSQVNY